VIAHILLCKRDQRIDRPDILPGQLNNLLFRVALNAEITLFKKQINHPLQPQPSPIFRRKDLPHAVRFNPGDLLWHNYAAAATKDLDMPLTPFPQKVNNVFEEFDMAALITAHGNPLGILLDSRRHNLFDRTVVAQMDHLCPGSQQHSTNAIDGSIMAVEKTGGSHKTNLFPALVWRDCCGHHFLLDDRFRFLLV